MDRDPVRAGSVAVPCLDHPGRKGFCLQIQEVVLEERARQKGQSAKVRKAFDGPVGKIGIVHDPAIVGYLGITVGEERPKLRKLPLLDFPRRKPLGPAKLLVGRPHLCDLGSRDRRPDGPRLLPEMEERYAATGRWSVRFSRSHASIMAGMRRWGKDDRACARPGLADRTQAALYAVKRGVG